ncbi:hypothetical protein NQ317_002325 [Molorchus minor]|uniref:Carbonic anhydrase n=1 Tax=Molorchus minor TaxID=1323400 RepID=A0ABQ9J467_9CUCU|nr:hypothetical protein NQ317_002325 [Molorchus minor]
MEFPLVRNAGNIIPHSQHFLDEFTTNEPAALELVMSKNDIRHIIVCGHSDCKAINLLYQLQDSEFASQDNRRISPLRAWLCTHALSSCENSSSWKHELHIHALWFDIYKGEIYYFSRAAKHFVLINEYTFDKLCQEVLKILFLTSNENYFIVNIM